MSQHDDPQAELCQGALDGDLVRMKSAIRSGVSVNAKHNGWTPLHWAIYEGQYFAAKFLVRLGADVECQDEDGRTPLLSVIDEAWGWSEFFVTDLIRLGVNLDQVDKNGDTAIQLAVYRDLGDVVDLLLNNGAKDRRNFPCWEQRAMDGYYDAMSDAKAVRNLVEIVETLKKKDG